MKKIQINPFMVCIFIAIVCYGLSGLWAFHYPYPGNSKQPVQDISREQVVNEDRSSPHLGEPAGIVLFLLAGVIFTILGFQLRNPSSLKITQSTKIKSSKIPIRPQVYDDDEFE